MTKLAYTILAVKDLAKARKFYEDCFDQVMDVNMGKLIGFSFGLALWEQEDMATKAGLDQENPIFAGRGGMEIEFHTEDIEGVFARVQGAGVEIIHGVRSHPWGQLVFRCLDLDGHCIEVDEYLWATAQRLARGGQGTPDIAKLFGVTIEAVEAMLIIEAGDQK